MKSTRQNIILQIISEQEIETQNQLMDVLGAARRFEYSGDAVA